jgi:hypothetical protein
MWFSSTENGFPWRAIKKALYSASGDDPESKLHNMGDWVYALRPRPRYKSFLQWLYPRPDKDAMLETARFAAVTRDARRHFLLRLILICLPFLGGGGAIMYYWWGMEFNADPITGTSAALRLELQPGLSPLLIQMVGLGLLLGGGLRLVWACCECTASKYVERWHPCMTNAAVVHNVTLTKTRLGFSLLYLLACPAVGTLLRVYPCIYSERSVGIGLGVVVFALMMAVPYLLTVALLKVTTFEGDGAVRALFLPALQPHFLLAMSAILLAAPSSFWWQEELYQGIWNRTGAGLGLNEIYCTTYFNVTGAGFFESRRFGRAALPPATIGDSVSTSSSKSSLYAPFTPVDARLVRCPATAIEHWPLRSFDTGPMYLYSYAESTGYYDYHHGMTIARIEAGVVDADRFRAVASDDEVEKMAQAAAVEWHATHTGNVSMEILRLNASLVLQESAREGAMASTELMLHPAKPWTNRVLNQPTEWAFTPVDGRGGAGLVHTPAVCGGIGGLVELCVALVLLPCLLLGVPIAVAGVCADTKKVAKGRWRQPKKLGAHGRMVGLADSGISSDLPQAVPVDDKSGSVAVGVKHRSAWICLRVWARAKARLTAAIWTLVSALTQLIVVRRVCAVFVRVPLKEDALLEEMEWREQLQRMRDERPAVIYFPPRSRTEAALLREKTRAAGREAEVTRKAAANAKEAAAAGKASGGAGGNKGRQPQRAGGAVAQAGAVAAAAPVHRRRHWRWEHWDSDEEGGGDHDGGGEDEMKVKKKNKKSRRRRAGNDANEGGEGTGFNPHVGGSSLFLRVIKFPFKDKYQTITFYGWDAAAIIPLLEPLRATTPGAWPAVDISRRLLLCLLAVGLHPAPTEIAKSPPLSVSPFALSDGARLQLCAVCLALHLVVLVLVQPYASGVDQALSALCCSTSLIHALYGIALSPPSEVWAILHPLLSAEMAWGGVDSGLTHTVGTAVQGLLMLVIAVAVASLLPPLVAMRAAAKEAQQKARAIKDMQVQWSQRKRELHGCKVLPGVDGDPRFMNVHKSRTQDLEVVSSFIFTQAKCGRKDMLQYWDECIVPTVPYGWRSKPENKSLADATAADAAVAVDAGNDATESLAKHKFANCFVPVPIILAGKRLGANVLTLQSYPTVGGIFGLVAGGHCGGVSLLHCAILAKESAVVRWLIQKDVEFHRYLRHLRLKEQHRQHIQGGAKAVPIPEGDRHFLSAFQSAVDQHGRCALMAAVEGACEEWAETNRFAVAARKNDMEELLANDFGLILHEKHRLEGTYDFQANMSTDPHAAQKTKFKRRRKVWKKPMVLPNSLGKKIERTRYNKHASSAELGRQEQQRLAKEESEIRRRELADGEEQRQELEAYYDRETSAERVLVSMMEEGLHRTKGWMLRMGQQRFHHNFGELVGAATKEMEEESGVEGTVEGKDGSTSMDRRPTRLMISATDLPNATPKGVDLYHYPGLSMGVPPFNFLTNSGQGDGFAPLYVLSQNIGANLRFLDLRGAQLDKFDSSRAAVAAASEGSLTLSDQFAKSTGDTWAELLARVFEAPEARMPVRGAAGVAPTNTREAAKARAKATSIGDVMSTRMPPIVWSCRCRLVRLDLRDNKISQHARHVLGDALVRCGHLHARLHARPEAELAAELRKNPSSKNHLRSEGGWFDEHGKGGDGRGSGSCPLQYLLLDDYTVGDPPEDIAGHGKHPDDLSSSDDEGDCEGEEDDDDSEDEEDEDEDIVDDDGNKVTNEGEAAGGASGAGLPKRHRQTRREHHKHMQQLRRTVLNLRGKKLSPNDAILVAGVLQSCRSLQVADLRNNLLGRGHAVQVRQSLWLLLEALGRHPCLHTLDLSDNGFNDMALLHPVPPLSPRKWAGVKELHTGELSAVEEIMQLGKDEDDNTKALRDANLANKAKAKAGEKETADEDKDAGAGMVVLSQLFGCDVRSTIVPLEQGGKLKPKIMKLGKLILPPLSSQKANPSPQQRRNSDDRDESKPIAKAPAESGAEAEPAVPLSALGSRLTSLDLGANRLTIEALGPIASCIARNATLTELDLRANRLADDNGTGMGSTEGESAWDHFASVVTKATMSNDNALDRVNFSENRIGGWGKKQNLQSLAPVLCTRDGLGGTMVRLELRSCRLNTKDLSLLAAAINGSVMRALFGGAGRGGRGNKPINRTGSASPLAFSLRHLDLSENVLGNFGISSPAAPADAETEIATAAAVAIAAEIGANGLVQFCNALRHFKRLEVLRLVDCCLCGITAGTGVAGPAHAAAHDPTHPPSPRRDPLTGVPEAQPPAYLGAYSTAAVEALCTSLQQVTELRELQLGGNLLHEQGAGMVAGWLWTHAARCSKRRFRRREDELREEELNHERVEREQQEREDRERLARVEEQEQERTEQKEAANKKAKIELLRSNTSKTLMRNALKQTMELKLPLEQEQGERPTSATRKVAPKLWGKLKLAMKVGRALKEVAHEIGVAHGEGASSGYVMSLQTIGLRGNAIGMAYPGDDQNPTRQKKVAMAQEQTKAQRAKVQKARAAHHWRTAQSAMRAFKLNNSGTIVGGSPDNTAAYALASSLPQRATLPPLRNKKKKRTRMKMKSMTKSPRRLSPRAGAMSNTLLGEAERDMPGHGTWPGSGRSPRPKSSKQNTGMWSPEAIKQPSALRPKSAAPTAKEPKKRKGFGMSLGSKAVSPTLTSPGTLSEGSPASSASLASPSSPASFLLSPPTPGSQTSPPSPGFPMSPGSPTSPGTMSASAFDRSLSAQRKRPTSAMLQTYSVDERLATVRKTTEEVERSVEVEVCRSSQRGTRSRRGRRRHSIDPHHESGHNTLGGGRRRAKNGSKRVVRIKRRVRIKRVFKFTKMDDAPLVVMCKALVIGYDEHDQQHLQPHPLRAQQSNFLSMGGDAPSIASPLSQPMQHTYPPLSLDLADNGFTNKQVGLIGSLLLRNLRLASLDLRKNAGTPAFTHAHRLKLHAHAMSQSTEPYQLVDASSDGAMWPVVSSVMHQVARWRSLVKRQHEEELARVRRLTMRYKAGAAIHNVVTCACVRPKHLLMRVHAVDGDGSDDGAGEEDEDHEAAYANEKRLDENRDGTEHPADGFDDSYANEDGNGEDEDSDEYDDEGDKDETVPPEQFSVTVLDALSGLPLGRILGISHIHEHRQYVLNLRRTMRNKAAVEAIKKKWANPLGKYNPGTDVLPYPLPPPPPALAPLRKLVLSNSGLGVSELLLLSAALSFKTIVRVRELARHHSHGHARKGGHGIEHGITRGAACRQLRSLDLSDNPWICHAGDTRGLQHLVDALGANAPKIRSLELRGCELPIAAVEVLRPLSAARNVLGQAMGLVTAMCHKTMDAVLPLISSKHDHHHKHHHPQPITAVSDWQMQIGGPRVPLPNLNALPLSQLRVGLVVVLDLSAAGLTAVEFELLLLALGQPSYRAWREHATIDADTMLLGPFARNAGGRYGRACLCCDRYKQQLTERLKQCDPKTKFKRQGKLLGAPEIVQIRQLRREVRVREGIGSGRDPCSRITRTCTNYARWVANGGKAAPKVVAGGFGALRVLDLRSNDLIADSTPGGTMRMATTRGGREKKRRVSVATFGKEMRQAKAMAVAGVLKVQLFLMRVLSNHQPAQNILIFK